MWHYPLQYPVYICFLQVEMSAGVGQMQFTGVGFQLRIESSQRNTQAVSFTLIYNIKLISIQLYSPYNYILHTMTFSIQWHSSYNDILHTMTFFIQWHSSQDILSNILTHSQFSYLCCFTFQHETISLHSPQQSIHWSSWLWIILSMATPCHKVAPPTRFLVLIYLEYYP